jgi:ABC-type sugar transport system ATPase subunit
MEIEYSNFSVNPKIYGTNEITGIFDPDGDFVYNNFYDIKKIQYNENMSVNMYLKFGINSNNKKTLAKMMSELEFNKSFMQKKLKVLSSSELIKVLVLKSCLSNSKVVFLENIDIYLTNKDLENLLRVIKGSLNEISKTVIFVSNKIDNIVKCTDRYVISENGKIKYNGKDLKELPLKTEIMDFVDLANNKKANVDYYKDINDLLKAIYRSVKK